MEREIQLIERKLLNNIPYSPEMLLFGFPPSGISFLNLKIHKKIKQYFYCTPKVIQRDPDDVDLYRITKS